jgi:chromosome segregation ATPase
MEYCEKQLDLADDKKKGLEQTVSDEETAISEAKEGIASLQEDIAALQKGIKALDKAVAEATEQRKEENEEFTQLMATDTAAKEILGFAKNRLNKFYNPKLYVPKKQEYSSESERIEAGLTGTPPPTPPPGGIAGTGITALDQASAAAPPSGYSGMREDSGGVIAMINLLIKNLDKEMTEATTEDKDAQSDYEVAMKDSAQKRTTDAKTLSDKSSAKASLEGTSNTKSKRFY